MANEPLCKCRFHEISDKKCDFTDLRAEVEVLNCKIAARDSIIAGERRQTVQICGVKNKRIAELEAQVSKMSKIVEIATLLAEEFKPIVDGKTS